MVQIEVDKWRSISLSKGGRLTLAQLVLNSLPCYLFSLMQASVGVINRNEKTVRNFVWNGGLVSWLSTLLSGTLLHSRSVVVVLELGPFVKITMLSSRNGCEGL